MRENTFWGSSIRPLKAMRCHPGGWAYLKRENREASRFRLVSKRETGIAFEDAALEAGPLARAPHRHAVDDAIAERPSLRARAAFERTRDAHELAFAGDPWESDARTLPRDRARSWSR